ncbi:MAG: nucleotidyltransferase domain-containing protein [Anaerolineaceae bacterium]|nr:nucleotidyltransferase domain-containing protein [Anaerolineaceae bacterium]
MKLDVIQHLPEEKRNLLLSIVEKLKVVAGVKAVVLGGSYASKQHHAGSDLDIGIYYNEAEPFDINPIRNIATSLAVDGEPTVTGFYEWGAWVNGGAWINTSAGKVDFLYRNIDHIQRTINEAQHGISHHDFDQQPAYGFYSIMYLAEMKICIPLFDPSGILARLKEQVALYPQKLKQKTISDCLWAAEFTLLHAHGFAEKGEIYNTAGCLTRAASNLTQVLFALNERYFIRDKQVMQELSKISIIPDQYPQKIESILANIGSEPETLMKSVGQMCEIWKKVKSLPGVKY